MTEIVTEKLKMLPTDPGVYIMKNAEGTVIYVGKAKNLKNRVKQYFYTGVKTDKVMAMVSHVSDFDYIITPTEIDALTLENNLIKKHKPRYNILLKDDKTYPYLAVNLKEPFPTFRITRKIRRDGSRYFGPYMGGVSVREVLEILSLAFSLRPCATPIVPEKPRRPCLNYHIKRCMAPCAGLCTAQEYREKVDAAIDFLNGNEYNVEKILRDRMLNAAANEEFEQAANYRDKLGMLEKVKEKRLVAINRFLDADIVSFVTNNVYSAVNLLVIRKGVMLGGKSFSMEEASFDRAEALAEFIARYYKEGAEVPDEIVVNAEGDFSLLEEYFKEKSGKIVNILCPKMGVRKQLSEMAEKNAADYLEKTVDKIRHKEDRTVLACRRLQEALRLSRYPRRMECYDISHISGVDKVGSMVVFADGEPERDSYRRFKIRTVEGSNDFACLQEVLKRRLGKLGTEEEERFPRPDLIVIDGGKGQLSSVKEIFDGMGVEGIDLVSLAKREEEVFTLFSRESVRLDHSDYALQVLQRLRDEAHRFAITYHRTLRGKRALSSVLDGIEGIGRKRRMALMERFKDIYEIEKASVSQLTEVAGIGKKQAEAIVAYFSKEENHEI
jgi:excinuclease ABC, C subunit